MQLAYRRIKELVPDFGERSLGQEDIDQFLYDYDVDITEIHIPRELQIQGFYDAALQTMVISNLLRGAGRLEVCWHEIIHHGLHVPVRRHPWDMTLPPPMRPPFSLNDRHEAEARALALVAIIPLWMLRSYEADRLYTEYDVTQEMLVRRRSVFQNYRI